MIVPKEEIREIMSGKLDEVRVTSEKPPALDTIQALQSRVGKRASCTVKVLETWPHRDGGHVVRVEVATRPIEPRYLRPKGGYTTDPSRAMQDEAGVAEWAPPERWCDSGVGQRASDRRRDIADAREALSIGAQLDAYLADARASRKDVHNRVNKIRREIELLARDLEDQAA